MKRREVLRRSAFAGVVGTVGLSAAGAVSADHTDAKPDHVTLSYDQDELENYRPRVDVPSTTDIRPSRWYAWTARSPEYEYDVHVYWLFYESQTAPVAAHRPDREPVYVFVDPSVGDVREAVYSAWHWMKYRWQTPLVEDTGTGRHVTLRADPDYHHYYQTEETGELFPVDPLGTEDGDPFSAEGESATTFEKWVSNSWEDALATGVAQDPERMRFRESWWANGAEKGTRFWWGIQLKLAELGLDTEASGTDVVEQ